MNIPDIRRRIDLIDLEILSLLSRRMELAVRINKLKDHTFVPSREQEVINNVRANSHGVLAPDFTEKLFKQIMAEAREQQSKDFILVGFQGEHGAYSEVAIQHYDAAAVAIPHGEFVEVFEGVQSGVLDFGIVPVENSLGGNVSEVDDLLIETDLRIVGEIVLPIHHCLLSLEDSDFRDIRVVYSHPQALSQCRGFITRNKLEARPYYDTAGAALMLSRERPAASAVIASPLCARLYNLEVLKQNIEDVDSNSTRFLVLARESQRQDGQKCSLVCTTAHKPGALFHLLSVFSEAQINLTRIESRPVPKNPGAYAFILDFAGSDSDPKVTAALKKAEQEAAVLKLLGCYSTQVVNT